MCIICYEYHCLKMNIMNKHIVKGTKYQFLILIVLLNGAFLIIYSGNDGASIRFVRQYILSMFHETTIDNSCPLVLNGGRFVQYDRWKPYGCTLHNYSSEDTQECERHDKKAGSARDHIILMGNSRVRYIFNELKKIFNKSEKSITSWKNQKYATDFILIDFLWCPEIHEANAVLKSLSALPLDKRPGFIIVGTAAWSTPQGKATPEALNYHKAEITAIQSYVTELKNTTTLIWMIQARLNETAFNRTKPEFGAFLTNQQINLYNAAAYEILRTGPFHIWSTAKEVAEGFYKDYFKDGIHVAPRANYWSAQLLLNVFCNRRMKNIQATCCRPKTS